MQHTNGAASPSPSCSSSSSEGASPDIEALKADVRTTNTLSAHIALINALRETADLTQLREAFKAAYNTYPLPPSTWLDYLADETALATTPQSRRELLALHTRALSDFSTPALHARRISFALTLLKDGEIGDDAYDQFIAHAAACGAGYDVLFKQLCAGLPKVEHIFKQPPPEHSVFEKRVADTMPANVGSADEARITAYLFYTRFAEDYSTFAISVYEHALSETFLSPVLWKQYDAFLTHVSHPSRPSVLARACRILPHQLELWRRAVSIADAPELVRVIDNVEPFVMKSDDLPGACHLTKDVWTRFLALGCPAEVRWKVDGCLQFNVPESVEWASACTHAAAIMIVSGDSGSAVKLMEDVVTTRPEARWWLAYAGLMTGETKRKIYERGIRSVGSLAEVHVMRDTWEIFEVSLGGEGVMDRIKAVSDAAVVRNAERMKSAPADRGERRHGKPAKRRRAERGKNDNTKEDKNGDKTGRKKVSEVQENGTNWIEEDKNEDASTAKPAVMDDRVRNLRDTKPGTKAVKTRTPGVEPRTVFLNNLPFSVTESDLQEAFSFAGVIKQIRLPKRSDGATKGIAYVEFGEEDAVDKALTFHNKPIKGRAAWVRRSKPPPRSRKGGRRGGPTTAVGDRHQGVRQRAVVLPHLDSTGERRKDAQDGDVVMDDKAVDDQGGGMRQDDFRKLFLGNA